MSKILIHSLVFSPDGATTAYLMTDLALELKYLGHTVTVISTTPHYNLFLDSAKKQPMRKHWLGLLYSSELDGISIWHVKVPYKGTRVWLRVFDYIRFHVISVVVALFKMEPQEIVIATSPPMTMAIVAWFLGKLWKVPSVYKVAELYPDIAIRQGFVKNKYFISFLKWLERFIYKKNTMIVPIADQFYRVIKQRGALDSKLKVIPDFVDTKFYSPRDRKNEFSLKYITSDEFIVLYAGNIGIVQDWDTVLSTAEILQGLPIKFVIVGDGSKRDWFQIQIETRNLKNILLVGYQPNVMMPEVNACCDVSIIPMNIAGSKDGVPSKIYSILACAKPVIALVDEGSELRTIIKNAGCGKAVPIGDSRSFSEVIVEMFKRRESLEAEGKRGREYVEKHYSKEAIAKEYDTLIKELIEHNSEGKR